VINALTSSWIWPSIPDADPTGTTCAVLVIFTLSLSLTATPHGPVHVHLTADTRYKLSINSTRLLVGPARSDPESWFYDTVDIAPFLQEGDNVITVEVVRWYRVTGL
jgi:hypothetical protein